MDTSAPQPSSVPPAQQTVVMAPIVFPAPRKSPWRWVARIGLLLVVVVVGVAAAAPTVVSNSPELRDRLIRRFMGKLDGDITIKSFAIGWTTPLEIEELALLPHSNSQPVSGSSANQEPLVKIHRIESERTLWSMLWDRSDIGTIRIERPEVFVALSDKRGDSNFEKVFGPILEREAKTPRSLTFGVRAQIVDGTIRGISNTTREPWSIPGVNVAVGVRSAKLSKSGKPELFVEKGTLISHAQLNVGVCNDVLKYIAPPLAARAKARGSFSVDLDEWRLPWKDFGNGELSGRLTMHTVDIGPGPLTESYLQIVFGLPLVGDLLRSKNLPDYVTIADNSVVKFEMVPGGKIHHEGLKFGLAGWVDVQSRGNVGLDESLDLTTWLGIHPPNPEERRLAILRQLSDQQWPLNIRGKIGAPEIDASPLNVAWKQLLLQKLPADWLSGRSSLGADALRSLNESGVLTPERTGRLLGLMQTLAAPSPTPVPHQVQKVDPNAPPGPAPANPSTAGPALGSPDGAATTTTVPKPTITVPPPPTPSNGPPAANPPGLNGATAGNPTNVPPPGAPIPSATAEPPKFGVADGVQLGLDVLGAIRAHRQQQQRPPILPPGVIPQQPPAPVPPAAAPPGVTPAPADPAATAPPTRRPLLRQGLRMLLDTATQPPSPQPSGSQPPTSQPPVGQPPQPELPAPAKREP